MANIGPPIMDSATPMRVATTPSLSMVKRMTASNHKTCPGILPMIPCIHMQQTRHISYANSHQGEETTNPQYLVSGMRDPLIPFHISGNTSIPTPSNFAHWHSKTTRILSPKKTTTRTRTVNLQHIGSKWNSSTTAPRK